MAEPVTFTVVPFRSGNLNCVQVADGRVFVNLRPVCDQLGIDFAALRQRIIRSPALFDFLTEVTGQDGRTHGTGFYVFNEHLPFLILKYEDMVPDGPRRAAVVAYVKELRDVLADYCFRGAAFNARFPPEQVRLEFLRFAYKVLVEDGGAERDRLIFQDAVRNDLLLTNGGAAESGKEQVSVSMRCRELGYPQPTGSDQYVSLGIQISDLYQLKRGKRPAKFRQTVAGGRCVFTNTYYREDCPSVLDPAIHAWHRARNIRPRPAC